MTLADLSNHARLDPDDRRILLRRLESAVIGHRGRCPRECAAQLLAIMQGTLTDAWDSGYQAGLRDTLDDEEGEE